MKRDEGDRPLTAPTLPDKGNNFDRPDALDISLLTGPFVLVDCYPWDVANGGIGPRPHDYYVTHFESDTSDIWTANTVQDGQQDWPRFTVKFHKGKIPDGDYRVYYAVQDFAQNPIAYSKETSIKIIGALASSYPPPTYPDFPTGSATYHEIRKRRGVRIEAAYIGIRKGDKVEFNWHGTDENGNVVPSSQYAVEYEVQEDGKPVYGLIPEEYVLCLGPGGKGAAYYHVCSAAPNVGGGDSDQASLEVSFTHIGSLEVNISQGAPIRIGDNDAQGMNLVRVFGRPGMKVDASLVAGTAARIVETGTENYSFNLDTQGMRTFNVWPNGEVRAMLTVLGDQSQPSLPSLTFRPAMSDSLSPALTYGFTTGAAADDPSFGRHGSYCSVYIDVDRKLAPSAKKIYVSVDGSAVVSGHETNKSKGQQATVLLESDGSAIASVVDCVAETVNVSLSLQDGNPPTKFQIRFDAFPSWKGDSSQGD